MSIRVRFLPIFCGGKFTTNARKGLAIIVQMLAKIVHETFLYEKETFKGEKDFKGERDFKGEKVKG
jgi:hypothetical protein